MLCINKPYIIYGNNVQYLISIIEIVALNSKKSLVKTFMKKCIEVEILKSSKFY